MSAANDEDFQVCFTIIEMFSLNVKRESAAIFLLTNFIECPPYQYRFKYLADIKESKFRHSSKCFQYETLEKQKKHGLEVRLK
jgi:hypothetical protein